MNINDNYSMVSYLRTKFRKILQDKNRDKNIQNYLCSFILVYWDSISDITHVDMNEFLSAFFQVPKETIEKYLKALHRFKNDNTSRCECLEIEIK